jgi:hypothetical protein
MLSAKPKGLFVEASRSGLMVAQASSPQVPLTVEKVVCISPDSGKEKVREALLALGGLRGARYAQCSVAVYPQSRFFYRHSVEAPAKLKEPNYFEEVIRSQMGVDLASSLVSIVNACDGLPFDPSRSLASQRELLFCGASVEEFKTQQEDLQGMGIYPLRLELGSLSLLGAIMSLARFSSQKRPVLYLELGAVASFLYVVGTEKVELCRSIPVGLDSMLPILVSELGMKDEAAARNMLYSNTFDFTEMGPTLLGKLMKEIRASTGFYEVQTGQSIGSVFLHLVSPGLAWVGQGISRSLGIEPLTADTKAWLESCGVNLAESVAGDANLRQMMGVFSLMMKHEGAKQS